MKKILLFITTAVIFFACKSGSTVKDEIWVRGNCGMCKERIETTAKNIPGVAGVEWNKNSKMLKVEYDSSVVKLAQISKAVALAGHETKTDSTPVAIHDELPECCQKNAETH